MQKGKNNRNVKSKAVVRQRNRTSIIKTNDLYRMVYENAKLKLTVLLLYLYLSIYLSNSSFPSKCNEITNIKHDIKTTSVPETKLNNLNLLNQEKK